MPTGRYLQVNKMPSVIKTKYELTNTTLQMGYSCPKISEGIV